MQLVLMRLRSEIQAGGYGPEFFGYVVAAKDCAGALKLREAV